MKALAPGPRGGFTPRRSTRSTSEKLASWACLPRIGRAALHAPRCGEAGTPRPRHGPPASKPSEDAGPPSPSPQHPASDAGRGLRCRSSSAPKPHSGPKRGRLPGLLCPPQHRHRSRCHLPPLTSSFSCISRSAHAIRAASAAWRADRSAASCARSCSVVTRRPRGSGPGVAGGAHDRSSGGIVIGCTAHAANSNSSQARRISGARSGWQRTVTHRPSRPNSTGLMRGRNLPLPTFAPPGRPNVA